MENKNQTQPILIQRKQHTKTLSYSVETNESSTDDKDNLQFSKSWCFSENKYPKKKLPISERRKIEPLSPIFTNFPFSFEPNFQLLNVIKVQESNNVTKLVLRKKEDTTDCIVIDKERQN